MVSTTLLNLRLGPNRDKKQQQKKNPYGYGWTQDIFISATFQIHINFFLTC